MPEPLRPTPAKSYGRSNWVLIQTIASATLAPSVAEITATTSLDVTRIVFASSGRPSQSTNRVTSERRLGDTILNEFIGTTTYAGGELIYAVQPQAASGSDGKKLLEKLPEGARLFLAERKDVPRATAFTAGQFLTGVYPVEFGPSFPVDQGDAEAAEAAMTATFAIYAPPAFNVAITA